MNKVKFSLWNSCSLMIVSLFLAGGQIGWNGALMMASIDAGLGVTADLVVQLAIGVFLLFCVYAGYRIGTLSIDLSIFEAYGKGHIDGGEILGALFTDEEIAMRRVQKEMQIRELARLEKAEIE